MSRSALQTDHSNSALLKDACLLVGSGECGAALGAEAVRLALDTALEARGAPIPVVAAGCDGTCFAAVSVTLHRPAGPIARWERVRPDSAPSVAAEADCILASSSGSASSDESGRFPGQSRRLLAHCGRCDPIAIEDAFERGRYLGLRRSLALCPEEIVDEIARSGLTGRGGAYFPVAAKWAGCRAGMAPRELVVNAEEGEPGVFKDRHLLEGDPHLLIEGLLIAALAIGAGKVVVFLNGRARLAGERLAAALAEARAERLIGSAILGSNIDCEVELRWGGGGYVLGEESALLEGIEGNRPMPRVRPPFPIASGLWGRPTAVNNVESLCNVALIMERGAEWFREAGTERWPGTKLICVSGNVARPGVVEVGIGTTLRALIEEVCGGVPGGHSVQAVLTGGPSGVLVPPSLLDTPLEPRNPDVFLGSGNVTVIDERQSLLDLVRRLARFNAQESCGKCTPCREGVNRMHAIIERIAGGDLRPGDRADLEALCEIAASASLCAHGQMAPNPVRSVLAHFGLPEFNGLSDPKEGQPCERP